MKKPHFIFILPLFFMLVVACQKWTDPAPVDDPRIKDRKYCNDPLAVNYNWGFPGVADSTTCVYPADLFKGTYTFTDSVYFNDETTLDSAHSFQTYTLQLSPISKTKFHLSGFCSNDLVFTAGRSTYQASADTTLKLNDTTYAFGQPLCRIQDTLTGTISKSKTDSTFHSVTIAWKVISDSGINYHKGTAIKQ